MSGLRKMGLSAAILLLAAAAAWGAEPALLERAERGPLAAVQEIIFAQRQTNMTDGHWYANFGYYCPDENRKAYGKGDGRLCKLNLRTARVTTLLDDPKGGVRDPQVHYDGGKILFSYRKGGSEYYHLYEINADGTGLRQITDGPFDDIEPTYLPNGDIAFVSSRCKRWVNCWLVQVAIVYRCDADGKGIHPLSANIEQDNTPWVLPDGRLMYTRWEYVDRSQLGFHHLWVSNPDGTGVATYFGNMHHGTVMIDAKPVPGSNKIVAIFSPGHGQREHAGVVTLVDPEAGPDAQGFARPIGKASDMRDPYPLSADCFLAAEGNSIVLLDGQGNKQVLYTGTVLLHEPRPLLARPREPIIPDRTNLALETGRVVLSDVNYGRNMAGVRPGEIKKLLVLETLPKPVNFTGGTEPLSQGGTFTLERILGTVPVEADGSAYVELPAMRAFFFVALDEKNLAVKRMQSFLDVQPGETQSCSGCHEQRTSAAPIKPHLLALTKAPSKPRPFAEIPDVMDFPRDIQPILDRHCVSCHNADREDGGVNLSGDRGPIYSHSFYTLFATKQVVDGRNAYGNHAPRTIGSSASPLIQKIDSHHYNVKLSEAERLKVILWIETGAAYPGTYAALLSGMLGGYVENRLQAQDSQTPAMLAAKASITRRCASCHGKDKPIPVSPWDDLGNQPWVGIKDRISRHLVFNLTTPEKSLILRAPLARDAGGFAGCGASIFASAADADYQAILTAIREAKSRLDQIKRFDMPGFRPNLQYIREMKRYGVLPGTFDAARDPIDPYAIDQAYWKSLWYRPQP